jgi:riboflavin synthase
MFSGIIEEVGQIKSIQDSANGRRLKIGAKVITSDLKTGDSICVSGACLTALDFTKEWFDAEITHETLRRTKLGELTINSTVNLERSMRLSDRLGGHLVSGHIDNMANVAKIKDEGFSKVIEFALDNKLASLFVEKGSVAVDGVSLTVAQIRSDSDKTFVFSVALIPHTLSVTTLGTLKVSDKVNIEADLIGKYVYRALTPILNKNINKEDLNLSFLAEHGYT